MAIDLSSPSGNIRTSTDENGHHIQSVSNYSAGTQKTIFSRYLDANGNGTGNKDFSADYSSAAEIAYIQPGASEVFRVARMIVGIEDTSGFSAAEYGNLGGGLTNGVTVRKQSDGGTLIDLTDGLPVKTNASWGMLCYDVDLKTWGVGDELLVVRWTFAKAGQYLRLDGSNNERLEVVLNDDFSGLVAHTFMVQGYVE